ncbi:hypothetical protein ABH930_003624 [Kitasatospora sp. GAS204A]|uniref:SUKH-3 domain-containing protein n=1 Tax=unclassified Kitasatospora TaxID=2633591 RepID=UPI002474A62D|nr:SUKH-3 domain-containing protein [Kitasatospora sp. GAS204B]MDH6118679.1 hypothetical protein [Kitasatospora sp. GAS204B]
MAPPPTGRETEDWLTSHGWYPGRDIGARAEQLIALLVEDAEEQGSPLAPSRAAAEFLHTFGDLTLIYPGGSGVSMILQPTPGYDGDAEDINELAESLGEALFPVGYETSEDGTVLITPRGRFFYLHHTGGYYLGEDAWEAFETRLSGGVLRDAEDFFVGSGNSPESPVGLDGEPIGPPEVPTVASSLVVGDTLVSATSLSGDGEPNLHPTIAAFLTSLPPSKREPFIGYCAESLLVADQFWRIDDERADGTVCTIAQAVPHFAGSQIISRAVRDEGDPQHGQVIAPCLSCTALLEVLGVEILLS